METKLWIIVPCYNEEAVIIDTATQLLKSIRLLEEQDYISHESRILFVDDGSTDDTWRMISQLCDDELFFVGIKLSHNQGHQNALLAGMMYVKKYCDCLITIDADLQDDINTFPKFINKYNEGCHVVYGVRNNRKTDSFFKRNTAQLFYRIMNLMGVETIYNHADYRLLSSKALDALEEYEEVNLFLRGIVPLVGLKSNKIIYYKNI